MITMLDCIRRTPEVGERIFANALTNTDVLKEAADLFSPPFTSMGIIAEPC